MVILGIDPGLNATGYGMIEVLPTGLRVMMADRIRTSRTWPLAERLAAIYDGVTGLIGKFRPDAMVLEQIFTHHTYVSTAALMAHARGVICLAAQEHAIPLAEYAPALVKKSITGTGAASKDQVARMVAQWLRHSDPGWSSDATDALALAIVHAHLTQQQRHLPAGLPR